MDLYKIAVDEYRFQVKLNWDRTVYYMVLDTAIISVATGLLKLGNSPVLYLLIAAIFALGLGAAIVGIAAVKKGHQYYRRTVVRKTLLEDLLGLTKPLEGYPVRHTLSIGSTAGQNEHMEVLHNTERDGWSGLAGYGPSPFGSQRF